MQEQKRRIRELLLYEFKKGHRATKVARNICDVEGAGAVSIRKAQREFKKFRNGDISLERKKGSGRLCSIDSKALYRTVKANPTTTTRRLSLEFHTSNSTIWENLQRLGMVVKRCREVPHELTPAQKRHRVDVCRQLLTNPQDERFFKRIVTCDEKWIHFNNFNQQTQWLDPDQPALPVPRRGRFDKKVMLCVWWNFSGIIHFELVPDGRTINAELYSTQLERVHTVLCERFPELVNRKRVLFQQDNAKPHTAARTQQKIEELEWELLPHPAYSPDVAPSDYHLFRSMEHFLRGRRFSKIEDVETGCREFFASKEPSWYQRGIELLVKRWIKVIEHNGEYFVG